MLKSNLGDVRLQPKLIGTFLVTDPSVLRFKWKKISFLIEKANSVNLFCNLGQNVV